MPARRSISPSKYSGFQGGRHTVKSYQYLEMVFQNVKQLKVTNIHWKSIIFQKLEKIFSIFKGARHILERIN